MLPTMFRELLRSTLYSSSRPFSSSATRDSSFSTLSMSLLPVLREERPKIFFTLSIIKLKCLCDHNGNNVIQCLLDRHFHRTRGQATGDRLATDAARRR